MNLLDHRDITEAVVNVGVGAGHRTYQTPLLQVTQLRLPNQRISFPDLAKAVVPQFERLGRRQGRTPAELVLTQDLNAARRLSVDRLSFLQPLALAFNLAEDQHRRSRRHLVVSHAARSLDDSVRVAPPDRRKLASKDNDLI